MPPFLSPISLKSLKALLLRHLSLILLAFSFLTRLVPARAASDEDMGAACLYYPLVGLGLGCILVLPLWLGLFSGKPWIQAWLYVGLSLWLTRALHHDGLADLLDALGSGKSGDGFREVLKDSRIGTFGATGLIILIAGQLLFVSGNLEHARLAPLLYAPLFGRCLPVFLALIAPVSPYASLGRLLACVPIKTAAVGSFAALTVGGLLLLPGPGALICCLTLGTVLLLFMARAARKHGGYNGDFFGALIVCGEGVALLASCI